MWISFSKTIFFIPLYTQLSSVQALSDVRWVKPFVGKYALHICIIFIIFRCTRYIHINVYIYIILTKHWVKSEGKRKKNNQKEYQSINQYIYLYSYKEWRRSSNHENILGEVVLIGFNVSFWLQYCKLRYLHLTSRLTYLSTELLIWTRSARPFFLGLDPKFGCSVDRTASLTKKNRWEIRLCVCS